MKINKAEATVTPMQICGRLWKWPDRPDILNYPWASISVTSTSRKKLAKHRMCEGVEFALGLRLFRILFFNMSIYFLFDLLNFLK